MVKQSTQLKELKTQTQQPQFKELEIEVECQISAIKVVRDVEIERLLMELRLVRSCFSEEQLRKLMLQVFEETLPNPSIVKDEGRTGFLSDENLHFKDFVFEEPCEAQTLTSQEGLQTPNVSSQRLSVGMTPKTLRLSKPSEMLLSVHGSPFGVYKQNNMEAIYGMKQMFYLKLLLYLVHLVSLLHEEILS
ncbi:uncharacterized protein [Arachis hypogaea]|uniref:uncharacterized protein n=1 Tax=Arachis hypogaea TaxID=3818 RepID=UPI003B22645A